MRLVFFKTPKPKRFNFQPRYFDPKKDEWERRKAELGYDSKLSKEEQLRLRMSSRWTHPVENSPSKTEQLIRYFIYAAFILGSIYVILFTGLVENFLALFGVVSK
jgi:hypothetical protein